MISFASRLNYCPQVSDQIKVAGWWEGLINSDIGKSKDAPALVAPICWSVWLSGNGFVFQGHVEDPVLIARNAKADVDAFGWALN